jgi:hypothetical protein
MLGRPPDLGGIKVGRVIFGEYFSFGHIGRLEWLLLGCGLDEPGRQSPARRRQWVMQRESEDPVVVDYGIDGL